MFVITIWPDRGDILIAKLILGITITELVLREIGVIIASNVLLTGGSPSESDFQIIKRVIIIFNNFYCQGGGWKQSPPIIGRKAGCSIPTYGECQQVAILKAII